MRNPLAHAERSGRHLAAAFISTIFDQWDKTAEKAQ
jgi:hypothetical protein